MVDFQTQIREPLQTGDLQGLASTLHTLEAAELVEIIDALPTHEAAVVFRLLHKSQAAPVFDSLDTSTQADLVDELGHGAITEVFATIDPDEQARLLDELPARVAKRLVASIDVTERGPVMALLGYPTGSVGRHMSPTRVRAYADDTVATLATRINTEDVHIADFAAIPVITRDRILLGTLDPADVWRSAPGTVVTDIMHDDPIVATTNEDIEHASRQLLDSGSLLAPVVDKEHRLVGLLPISDAAKIDKEAVAEDQARAGASEPLRRPYLLTPVRKIARSRIVWLLVLAVSAVLTVNVLELYEATLEQQVALALFIPLLTGIGGNTGSQAATTVTRALAMGEVRLRDAARVAFKEVRTGFMLGAILAVLAFGIASLVYEVPIGIVIGLTIIINLPIAATVGGVIPLVARACKVDPAVFSTPFISTFCDASGLMIYFTVAISVLGLG